MQSDTASLVGKKFGKLTVLSFSHIHPTRRMTVWNCLCDCGRNKKVARGELISKTAISCGCWRDTYSKMPKPNQIKHGLSKHPIYRIWAGIKVRCSYASAKNFHRYGARGIKMCSEWESDFLNFYNWSISHGWRKGLQIDRINNDGHYEPVNCRWATSNENVNNRRCTIFIEMNGIIKTASEWAKETGVNQKCITNRFLNGYRGKEAVFGIRKILRDAI